MIEFHGSALALDTRAAGRLFKIPDDSSVRAFRIGENEAASEGTEIQFTNPLTVAGEANSVIVFHDEDGSGRGRDALYVRKMMLVPEAPHRLATIAFGLMAITAYRLGFSQIRLFAAGKGPLAPNDLDAFVGYVVWPKFGFDAEVVKVDVDRFPTRALAAARSIQDVIAACPHWWRDHGTAREMAFDLAPASRSWTILLHYLYEALEE